MKSLYRKTFRISFCAGWFFCYSLWAGSQSHAQLRKRQSPVQALEYSLKSLYESAAEVSNKNKWLKNEIMKMDQEVTFFREEVKSLETKETKKRVSTALESEDVASAIPWDEERLNMMYEDYVELDTENNYMKDRLDGKLKDQNEIEDSIKQLEKELAQLTKQKAQLQQNLDKKEDYKEIARLKNALSRSEGNVIYAKKKLKKVEGSMGAPIRGFNQAKDKNISLKAKVVYLMDKKQALVEEEEMLLADVSAIKEEDGENLGELKADLETLRGQQKTLLGIIAKADIKLGRDFSVPDYSQHLNQVKHDIETARQENEKLKSEMDLLQKKILGLQSSPSPDKISN